MKLDDLISKYLDGELSYNDDIELRQMLKENPDAKADFDAAVLINATIREDASMIKTPSDLLVNTEDLVLMRILAEDNSKARSKEKRRIIAWLPRFSFVFAIFIFVAIYFITDFRNPFVEKSTQSSIVNSRNSNLTKQNNDVMIASDQLNSKNSQTKNNKSFVLNTQNKEKSINSTSNTPVVYASNQDAIEANSFINNEIPTDISSDKSIVLNEINSNNNINSYFNNAINSSPTIAKINAFTSNLVRSNIYTENRLKPMLNLPMFENLNTPVVLNTIFSTSSYKNKPFATLSQSIGYNFDKKVSVGLEFGYTSYNYDRTTIIKVPISTGGALNSKLEIGNWAEQSAGYINLPINLEQKYRQYWISTFIDYNILDYNILNLNSRFGAGLSGNGALAYTRLMSELELYNGIYLKFGGELKTFEALMHNAKAKYITTGGLIYGLQLKLY